MSNRMSRQGSINVLHCPQRLDAVEVVRMKPWLTRILNQHPRLLLLDLAETRQVRLAGLGMLMDRFQRLGNGTGVRFANATPEVHRTLARAGVGELIAS